MFKECKIALVVVLVLQQAGLAWPAWPAIVPPEHLLNLENVTTCQTAQCLAGRPTKFVARSS